MPLQELPKTFDFPRLCKAVDDIIKAHNELEAQVKSNKFVLLCKAIDAIELRLEQIEDKLDGIVLEEEEDDNGGTAEELRSDRPVD
jgi:hypothetical protein